MFIFFLLLLLLVNAHDLRSLGTLQIKNFQLSRCPNTNADPITLKDVTVQIVGDSKFAISGIFTTLVDLNPPIRAEVELKKKVVFWIEVPCEKNVGSCNYDDVCKFGIPSNQSCPNVFITNKVPCRCPINKGTYILPKSIEFSDGASIYSGYYKGTINVNSACERLACYNVNFQLYDAIEKNSVQYVY